ncbi:THAP domain-containing protein 7 [Triplophysa rosa]|uniref:THAP domain-containing protein 7 n=1 Tax=Triplophysa rosa TaxID=992332 RepID=A0A9W7THW0_TRIRA|nr:THAP domain-containing protein 7 [Triplophysa rosa]KAI7799060.1 THAP domain-containing protein 7 [Triplophysa rosa]
MPRHCSAVGCKSRDTKGLRKTGITFHRLPKKGNPRRTSWIINSRRKGPGGKGQWDPQSHFIYFCSKHFTPDSFELSGVSGYRRLKDDAIPTVFEIQPQKRGTAKRCATKRRGRPRNVDKHISVKNSSNNEDSESEEIFNGGRVTQTVAHDIGVKSSEQVKREENQRQPPPQPSSEAVNTAVDDQLAVASSPQPSPRIPSPSCYMRRLPPPPGFYLPKEHNYAQLCPLLWRKHYDKAIDSLEKTLHLLSAARRRENRLRNALLRLRENRLKSTLIRVRDGVKGKEDKGGRFSSWVAQKADLLAEGWNGQALARSTVMLEDEEGFCLYCGRDSEGKKVIGHKEATVGPDDVQGLQVRCRPKGMKEIVKKVNVPKILKDQGSGNTITDVLPIDQQSYYVYYCESVENEDTMQVVTMELQPHQLNTENEAFIDQQNNAETIQQQLAVLQPQTEEIHPQMHTVNGPVQYSSTLHDTSAPFQLQVLQSHPGLLFPEIDTKDNNESEMDKGGGQHFYWVQERTDDHVILMSVPAETSEQSKSENDESVIEAVQHQSVLERFQFRVTEDPLHVKCDSTPLKTTGWGNSQVTHQSNLRHTGVGGDVRERLKEHLEGFELQLSSEFID